MVRDRRVPPDTRLAGSSSCLITGVHRDRYSAHDLALDMRALIRGFRTPAPLRGVVRAFGAGVRKPSKEETAGRKGAGLAGSTYGDLKVWAGALGAVRGPGDESLPGAPKTAGVLGCEDGLVWRGRCAWRRTAELARTLASCFGARPEARRSGVVRGESVAMVMRS